MTAVIDRPAASRAVGSMTPRIFTPPLPEHCAGPQIDPLLDDARYKDHYDYGVPLECPCGCGLNPTSSWGFSANRFARDILRRKLLPYQQWLNIHALEKDDETGGFRFKILVVLISRQQGKTFWLQQLGLWRLFLSQRGRIDASCPGAKLAIIAAQNLKYAEAMLKEVTDEIRENSFLSPELINHKVTNGNHHAILSNRRYWRAVTATRKGGRSLTVDIAMLDELREHVTTEAWDAIAPTTTTRKFSQIVCTSNAGDKRSIVLRNLRDPAMRRITTQETANTKTGLFEWSVPMDVDPSDDQYWYMANPALGNLPGFKLDALRAMFEAQQYRNLPGFQTENLALDITTPILTTAGWKTMETIEVGHRVYHPDGHPIDVTHVTPLYTDRPCYEVVTTDGRSVVADAQHRWMVQDRRRCGGKVKPFSETLNTEELLARGLKRNPNGGGAYAYRLPNQNQIISKPVSLPVSPYLLGAWLGDGTAGKSEIACIESDVDELTELLQVNVTSVYKLENASRINFRITPRKSRDGFPARCRELGIWSRKNVPDVYLTAGTEQRLALLQGLCDTDGSIDVNGRVRFCNTNKQIADSVLYLARSLGWRAAICEGTSKYGGKVFGSAYWVSWTHDAAEPPPFRLRRKLARINTRPSRAGERTTISIRSITPVRSRTVRCITVNSPDSLFLAGRDLLPTANCQWVDSLEPGIIPAERWADTVDVASRRAEGSPMYVGVDINYERSRAFIAVAARRADKNLHIEILNGARGTDWVIPWLCDKDAAGVDRRKKFAGVAIQKTGAPISGMLEDFRRAGIPVVEWGPGTELAGGCNLLFDGIKEQRIYHCPAPVLDRAAASGVSRPVGEGWVFDRRNSPVDVSPLVACAAAAWLEHQPPAEVPELHSWPDEETIKAWEAEAEEQFKDLPTVMQQPAELDDVEGTSWWRM